MSDAFDIILGQPKVRDFLRKSLIDDKITSSYLFLGPAGSNKTSAAFALAKEIMCPLEDKRSKGGNCGRCDICTRISKNNYSDVKYYEPKSASGYLVDQIRDIIRDISLSPVESDKKVYILDSVDMMGVSSANALLKTLEEPPGNVYLILLGRSKETVLPTIVSRCSVVAFRHIPPSEARAIIVQNTGCDLDTARIALAACGGSITGAIDFARKEDNSALYLRHQMASIIIKCARLSYWSICKETKELLEIIKVPSDEYIRYQEQRSSAENEFLSAAAQKEIGSIKKREASKKSTQMLRQLIDIMLSLLKDIEVYSLNLQRDIINCDYRREIEELARCADETKVTKAIDSLLKKKNFITYNVSSEILINTCLFEFRGAFNDDSVINRK